MHFTPLLSTSLVADAALLALELFEGNICYALLTSLLKISTKPQSSFDVPIHAHTEHNKQLLLITADTEQAVESDVNTKINKRLLFP